MNKLYVRVIFLALCLAAVVAAKIYVDRFASQIPVTAGDDPDVEGAPIAEYPAEYSDGQSEAAYVGEDDDTLPVDSLSVEGNTVAPDDVAAAAANGGSPAAGGEAGGDAAPMSAEAAKELQVELLPATGSPALDDASAADRGAASAGAPAAAATGPEAASVPAAAAPAAASEPTPGPRIAKP